jgi:hypothetical protein
MAGGTVTLNAGTGGSNVYGWVDGSNFHQAGAVQFINGGSPAFVSDSLSLPVEISNTSLAVTNADVTTLAGTVASGRVKIEQLNGETPEYVSVSYATGTTPLDLVAADADEKIRVTSMVLVAAGAVTAQIKAAGTNITGAMSLITGTPMVLPFNPAGWFETGVNEALQLVLGSGVQVSGAITYVKV